MRSTVFNNIWQIQFKSICEAVNTELRLLAGEKNYIEE